MTDSEKYKELKEFIFYHLTNNRKRTIEDIVPFMNCLMQKLGEPTYTAQRLKKGKE